MIRECKVILSNDVVTVVQYENKYIQLPSIDKNHKTVFVSFENGKYYFVDKQSNQKQEKHKKKTTVYQEVDANHGE